MGSSIPTPGADARIQGREITFDLNSAQPPINQYISKDDQLFLMQSCAFVGTTITIFARMMLRDGTLQQNQWNVPVAGSRSANFTAFPLTECFLLSMSVIVNTTSPQAVYVQLSIARGLPTLGFQHLVLCKGYVTGDMPLSWPWGVNTTNLDCAGNIRSITGTTPAAGAEISETVPAAAKWRLLAVRFTFTTSATVANRQVILAFDDGTNIFGATGNSAVQVASSALTYNCSATFGTIYGLSSNLFLPLPFPLFLTPNFRLRTSTVGIQAGDQYTAPQYLVEEWLLP